MADRHNLEPHLVAELVRERRHKRILLNQRHHERHHERQRAREDERRNRRNAK
jgi:hypothetical protein